MLLNLYVKNMALIEEADISFGEGLNILTGETGAGKSIIIGSVNAALGSKISTDVIRKGADHALVELTFKIKEKNRINELKAMGIEDVEDGQIVISRKISETRSVLRVNGETVNVSQVRKIAGLLLDVHGQHEHQSLLNESKHLDLIDRFAVEEESEIKEELRMVFQQYQNIRKQMSETLDDPEQVMREISFLKFEIDEIENAKLKPGEDEDLEISYRKMSNLQKIMEEVSFVSGFIGQNGDNNASDMVSRAVKAISSVVSYDASLETILSQLADIESLLVDVVREIDDYAESAEFDPADFDNIQNRLNLINGLKIKYGRTIEDILKYCENKKQKMTEYENISETRAALKQKLEDSEKRLEILSVDLSDIRKTAAKKLAESIKNALVELNFLDVRFEVEFEKLESYTSEGFDFVRFLISTNPGEELKPLARIASGGEMSRIMLAIKTVLADKDEIETLIFDEIDAGISGRTAQMVANKLNEIASMHQVICITHLPQIAAMADSHFLIEKSVKDNSTITSIIMTNGNESVLELARLLGGRTITDAVMLNAEEMKRLAFEAKKSDIYVN